VLAVQQQPVCGVDTLCFEPPSGRPPPHPTPPHPPCHSQLALKLSTAGVQKHPDNLSMRALKAVAFERTGKMDDALKVRLGPTARATCYLPPAASEQRPCSAPRTHTAT